MDKGVEKPKQKEKPKKKMPRILLLDPSDDEESEGVDPTYDIGDFVVVQYMSSTGLVFYAAVVNDVNKVDDMYSVIFYKCRGKKYFLFDEEDDDEIGIECIMGKLPPPHFSQKFEEIYYYFDCSNYDVKFE